MFCFLTFSVMQILIYCGCQKFPNKEKDNFSIGQLYYNFVDSVSTFCSNGRARGIPVHPSVDSHPREQQRTDMCRGQWWDGGCWGRGLHRPGEQSSWVLYTPLHITRRKRLVQGMYVCRFFPQLPCRYLTHTWAVGYFLDLVGQMWFMLWFYS